MLSISDIDIVLRHSKYVTIVRKIKKDCIIYPFDDSAEQIGMIIFSQFGLIFFVFSSNGHNSGRQVHVVVREAVHASHFKGQTAKCNSQSLAR